jgi:putative aminopeptidase FrvX
MSMAIMKLLAEEDIRFNNTEVCCLITGSEEAGLRGAKVWADKHKKTMANAETAFVVFETLRDLKYLTIYNKDLNGTVKNDPQVSELIKSAAKNCGIDIKYGTVTIGSTDSAAFSQEGLQSTAIAAMNPVAEKYYHTRLDNFDNISPECLEKVLEISLKALEDFDNNGLPVV